MTSKLRSVGWLVVILGPLAFALAHCAAHEITVSVERGDLPSSMQITRVRLHLKNGGSETVALDDRAGAFPSRFRLNDVRAGAATVVAEALDPSGAVLSRRIVEFDVESNAAASISFGLCAECTCSERECAGVCRVRITTGTPAPGCAPGPTGLDDAGAPDAAPVRRSPRGRIVEVLAEGGNYGLPGRTACARFEGGQLYCWGSNEFRQLLVPEFPGSVPQPVEVMIGTGDSRLPVVSASLRAGTACAVTSDGSVWCWGRNKSHVVSFERSVEDLTATALQRSDVQGATQVSVGSGFACALVAGGGIRCWGNGVEGQLGTPGDSPGAKTVDLPGSPAASVVVAGARHACALAGNAAYCWGPNAVGQVGVGSDASVLTPTRLAMQYTALRPAFDYTLALVEGTGRVVWWGNNGLHQVFANGPMHAFQPMFEFQYRAFNDAGPWADLVAGDFHHGGLLANGLLAMSGLRDTGQTGTGRDSGTEMREVELGGVAGSLRFHSVAAGEAFSCGLTLDDLVYCWGSNDRDQLGLGFNAGDFRDVPTEPVQFPPDPAL